MKLLAALAAFVGVSLLHGPRQTPASHFTPVTQAEGPRTLITKLSGGADGSFSVSASVHEVFNRFRERVSFPPRPFTNDCVVESVVLTGIHNGWEINSKHGNRSGRSRVYDLLFFCSPSYISPFIPLVVVNPIQGSLRVPVPWEGCYIVPEGFIAFNKLSGYSYTSGTIIPVRAISWVRCALLYSSPQLVAFSSRFAVDGIPLSGAFNGKAPAGFYCSTAQVASDCARDVPAVTNTPPVKSSVFCVTIGFGGSEKSEFLPSNINPAHSFNGSLSDDKRRKVITSASRMVGWKEKTGNNDGVAIDSILAAVGLEGTRNPYCAAFVVKCGDDALGRDKNPYPRSAWSPDMVKGAQWIKGKGPTPQPADTFGIFFPSKGRVAHTGLVEKVQGNVLCTYEGNTSPDAAPGSAQDRDGGGVYRKRRLLRQIYAVRNWID